MVRTILIPTHDKISIQLPGSFIGKQVEVIAFIKEDTVEESNLDIPFTHFASESLLAKEWLTAEEDKVWKDL